MIDLAHYSAADRDHVFRDVAEFIETEGFVVVAKDHARPWGGFFVIDEAQSAPFIETFFPEVDAEETAGKVSPKILVVSPGARLSWQYHLRRSELWRVLAGDVAVVASPTDEEQAPVTRAPGDLVRLAQGERHRLIGCDHWGVVAEIWRHTDPTTPSDEADIVRVQDDFGRAS